MVHNNTLCTAAFPCPFGYCNYASSNTCPTRLCHSHKFYCELDPGTESVEVCMLNC